MKHEKQKTRYKPYPHLSVFILFLAESEPSIPCLPGTLKTTFSEKLKW